VIQLGNTSGGGGLRLSTQEDEQTDGICDHVIGHNR
jgi:hypothetical protein